MKKVGFFGGTFDPIHLGHLNLALELLEKRALDEVLFCPAYQSPFKGHQPPLALPQHRKEMVLSALKDLPFFQLRDWELKRPGISYTIDALQALKGERRCELYLLLSSEALSEFHLWKEAKEIVRLAQPLVGVRGGSMQDIPRSEVKEALEKGMTATAQMEISSTEIRARLKKRLYCGHLLPQKVLDYIQKHLLYY